MKALVAQTRAEVVMTLRRGESLLLTLGIPVVLLGFFSLVEALPLPTDEPVAFLAPGVLALAIMSTSLTGLAIATGFEREYKVLKRLGTTPLGRPRLLTAKILAVGIVQVLQLAVLAVEAVALGWDPHPAGTLPALVAMVLATAGFGGLGLLMAGRLAALTTLAAANGLYLVLLLLGGMVIPLDQLPGAIEALARTLPAAALAEVVRAALSGAGAEAGPWLVLAGWAVAAPVAASLTFRWE